MSLTVLPRNVSLITFCSVTWVIPDNSGSPIPLINFFHHEKHLLACDGLYKFFEQLRSSSKFCFLVAPYVSLNKHIWMVTKRTKVFLINGVNDGELH